METSNPCKRYSVVIGRHVPKQLSHIPKTIVPKIIDKINSLQDTPFPRGCKKLSSVLNGYRIRLGIYRILYVVDTESGAITVVSVSHRKDAYTGL